jgi:hypothetical protein
MAQIKDKDSGQFITSLNETAIEMAREYIALIVSGEHDEILPTVAGLALHLGLTKMVMYNWKREQTENPYYADFCVIMDVLMSRQEVMLVNSGLSGKYTQQIVKMLLTHHGYSDAATLNHTSSDGTMTPAKPARELSDYELEQIIGQNESEK